MALLLTGTPLRAQARKAAETPPPPAAAAATRGRGLDALSDDALYGELATRGLDSLLERAFEVNHVPAEKRDGIRTIVALRKLADPTIKRTAGERAELLRTISAGIERALPAMNDPKVLMDQASLLAKTGVTANVNALEYWGENPRTQAELRPVAEAVIKLLDKCAAEAKRKADAIANQIKHEDEQLAAQWMAMDKLASEATLSRNMAAYFVAIAIDPADPKRREVAEEAITYLKQFDNPESGVQAEVRNRMGKLYMAEGEYPKALGLFQSVAQIGDDKIKPDPKLEQQYEARYFAVQADLLAKNVEEAEKGLAELRVWQDAALPAGDPSSEGAKAAADVMDYRIRSAKAELAGNDVEKSKYNQEAVNVLLALVKQRPQFRGVIYEQLANRVPAKPDLATLDPLLLQAIVHKGELERLKDPSAPLDTAVMEQAVAAARELISRQGKSDISDELVDNAALLVPFFEERLGHDAEAADAFLDYAAKRKSNLGNARLALDNGLAIVAKMMKEHSGEESTRRLYEKALPIAVGLPFERKEFSFDYAKLLQEKGQYGEAIEIFKQVPEKDPRSLEARFYEMLSLKQQLDSEREKLGVQGAAEVRGRIQSLAAKVTTGAKAALANSPDARHGLKYRSLIVKTVLLAAELANGQDKQPQRSLTMLEGFEDSVKGLPGESELLGDALFLRVDSYMDLGRNADATKALVELLNKESGDKGANIIYSLLQKLDRDLDAAKRSGDTQQMRLLARSRAELSGHLVNWASESKDPNIKRFTYRYRVFDAATKLQAAELESDPAAKRKALDEAMSKYLALRTPAAVTEYHETIQGTPVDADYPDPAVTMGMASVEFELGHFKQAQEMFGKLLTDRKLGTAGSYADEQFQENDLYWEATYKLLQSNFELGKSGDAAGLEESKSYLKRLYIQWGKDVGGKKWHSEFEALRAQFTPDFRTDEAVPSSTNPVAVQGTR
jgi:hypothetical protein